MQNVVQLFIPKWPTFSFPLLRSCSSYNKSLLVQHVKIVIMYSISSNTYYSLIAKILIVGHNIPMKVYYVAGAKILAWAYKNHISQCPGRSSLKSVNIISIIHYLRWGVVQRLCNGLPRKDPGFDSWWGQCKNQASRPSQGTVIGGAVSK